MGDYSTVAFKKSGTKTVPYDVVWIWYGIGSGSILYGTTIHCLYAEREKVTERLILSHHSTFQFDVPVFCLDLCQLPEPVGPKKDFVNAYLVLSNVLGLIIRRFSSTF